MVLQLTKKLLSDQAKSASLIAYTPETAKWSHPDQRFLERFLNASILPFTSHIGFGLFVAKHLERKSSFDPQDQISDTVLIDKNFTGVNRYAAFYMLCKPRRRR